MPKASPLRSNFNGGEFSGLMIGRTDLEKYPAAMRSMQNFVAAPQGPALFRSGTSWQSAVYNEAKHAAVIPFIFSEAQSNTLEFADLVMRVHTDAGPLVYTPVSITQVVSLAPLKIRVPGNAFAVGQQLYLSGLPAASNGNNRTAMITVRNGTGNQDITLDFTYTGVVGAVTLAYAAQVFTIATPYGEADVANLRYIESVDVMYLFCPKADGTDYRVYKLGRYGAYDWRLTQVLFNDGPYMPADNTGITFAISATGNVIPNMTSATAPSGVVSSSSDNGGNVNWHAFSSDDTLFWESNANQVGTLTYDFAVMPGPVVNGYVIYPPRTSTDATYGPLDYAPASWKFQGWTGSVWVTLDQQTDYVLWDDRRSVWFKINNTVGYSKYQIVITECRQNGPINPRIQRLVLTTAGQTLNLTASGIGNINGGSGFLLTDIDRLIRVQDVNDANWRTLQITARSTSAIVTVKLLSEPFTTTDIKAQWKLSYFSDTTGWPTCAEWFEDRLCLAGPFGTPDLIACTRTGAYEDMQQSTPDDQVLADSAVIFRMNSRRLSRIRWLATDERGLLAGTGSQEFVIVPADSNTAFSATNIRARQSTARGSSKGEPTKIDRQVLFVQANGKTLREFAYVYETDGYNAPSMSLYSSHLGAPMFVQQAYAAEPHNIDWIRRGDGTLVGFTYNREEEVLGWHQHDLAGGVVESICVRPSDTVGGGDVLWAVVARTVNGAARRYIERLMPFWDFGSTLATAHFLDCGLRYQGAATNIVYGLYHLEGCTINALVDGVVQIGKVVHNGSVTFDVSGANIVIGLPYQGFGEITNIDAGAGDGTAQGKDKRINKMVASILDSLGGEFGTYNEDSQQYEYNAVDYVETVSASLEDTPYLRTGFTKLMDMPQGYGKRGSITFRQVQPYPFNIVAFMPQLNTQDR